MRTLLWMQWRRTALVLLAVLPALLAVCAALKFAGQLGLEEEHVEIAGYAALFVAIGVAIVTLLLIHSDSDRLHASVPLRTLRLPVPTWKLALAFMSYGLVATGIIAAAAAWIVQFMLQLEFRWWLAPCIAVCILGAMQAWSYSMRDPNPRLATVTFLLFAVPVFWVLRQDAASVWLTEANPSVILIAAPLLLFAAGAAALSLNRRGGLPALLPENWTQGRYQQVDVKSIKPFRSPAKTQAWYEWRQFGWQLPAFMILVLILYFLLMPLLVGVFGSTGVSQNWTAAAPRSIYVDFLANAQFATNGLTVAAVVAGVFAGALMFMRAGYWNTKTEYLMTLPVSTRRLANARLIMALQSAVIALVIMATLMLLLNWAMIAQGEENRFFQYMQQGYRDVKPWQVTVFFLGALAVVMWVAVWPVNVGLAALVYLAAFWLPLGALYVLQTFNVIESESTLARVRNVGLWIAAGAMIGGFTALALAALQRRLASVWSLAAAVGALAVIGLAFWLFSQAATDIEAHNARYTSDPLTDRWPHPINWPLWLGLWVLPAAPVFVHPYFLERARHR